MKPNASKTLTINLGHLSPSTLELMSEPDFQQAFMIENLGKGFYLDTDSLMSQSPYQMPGDLLHILRYAAANDIYGIMLFPSADRQPGLPFYGDDQHPDLTDCRIEPSQLVSFDDFTCVNANHVSCEDLVVEQTWTETIPDGDFEAPDGAWIGVGPASIRIYPDQDGDIRISVFSRGREMDDALHSVILPKEDFNPDLSDEDTPSL